MQLYIKNFQGISEADIKLKGFTVLTGRSNSGKSSIRRALELVLYNKWDIGYLKTGESQCIVRLNLDDKNYIQITKPENTYTVMLDGVKSSYPKVGKNTLEELYALGLDYFYDSEGYFHNVHIRSQTDPWYYITYSNQEQSRIIASIFNFDEIKNILKKSYKDKAEETSKAETLASDIDNLKIEGQELSVRLQVLNKLKDSMESAKVLKDYLKLSNDIKSNTNSYSEKVSDSSKLSSLIERLNILAELKEFETRAKSVSSLTDNIKSSNRTLKSITSKLNIAKDISSKYEKQLILSNFIELSRKVSKTEDMKLTLNIRNNSVKSRLVIAKELLVKINTKTVLQNYEKERDIVGTKQIDYDYAVKKLKSLVTVRNKLVRFSSLKGYLVSLKNINTVKKDIAGMKTKTNDIGKTIIKVTNYIYIKEYVSTMEVTENFKSKIEVAKQELKNIDLGIKKASKVLNESVLCPHCSEPIGEFVKGCTK